MKVIGIDKDEDLKATLADIIRKKKWHTNKSYQGAMYELFEFKQHPYGVAHWRAAMRMVHGTRQLKKRVKKNVRYDAKKEEVNKKRAMVRDKATCWDNM